MGYWFVCPECYKILDLDDLGYSRPTAKVKLVKDKYCGNCGCDLTVQLQNAMEYLAKEQRQKRIENNEWLQ